MGSSNKPKTRRFRRERGSKVLVRESILFLFFWKWKRELSLDAVNGGGGIHREIFFSKLVLAGGLSYFTTMQVILQDYDS